MTAGNEERGLLHEGFLVGMAGATAVALWFLFVDLLNGVPFQTPGSLGSALFLGTRRATEVAINPTTVGLYTIFHGVIYTLVGIAAAALVRAANNSPSMVALVILAAAVLEALFLGFVATLAEFLLSHLAWWAVLGGNLLAAVAMGSLLLRWYPRVAQRLMQADEALPES